MRSWTPILFPFFYVLSPSRRIAAAAAFAYYGPATLPIIFGTVEFLGPQAKSCLYGLLFWSIAVVIGSLPWIWLYNKGHRNLSAIAALLLLALPPLSLITVAYPLTAAGRCFPGTSWIGLAVPLLALYCFRESRRMLVAGVLLCMSAWSHMTFKRPQPDPTIVAINTNTGPPSETKSSLLTQTDRVFHTAEIHPGKVVVFPETTIPAWSPEQASYWQSATQKLEKQHTSVIFGTTFPIRNTNANYNLLVTRGYGIHGAYIQRVPVPFMMWKLNSRLTGFPLQLHAFPYMDVRGHRAAVLLCYEQLLAWPALESLANRPELLIAPSNQYWTRRTNIAAVQHEAAQNWADLLSIPLYEVHNR